MNQFIKHKKMYIKCSQMYTKYIHHWIVGIYIILNNSSQRITRTIILESVIFNQKTGINKYISTDLKRKMYINSTIYTKLLLSCYFCIIQFKNFV